jgi:hypothetical protein
MVFKFINKQVSDVKISSDDEHIEHVRTKLILA